MFFFSRIFILQFWWGGTGSCDAAPLCSESDGWCQGKSGDAGMGCGISAANAQPGWMCCQSLCGTWLKLWLHLPSPCCRRALPPSPCGCLSCRQSAPTARCRHTACWSPHHRLTGVRPFAHWEGKLLRSCPSRRERWACDAQTRLHRGRYCWDGICCSHLPYPNGCVCACYARLSCLGQPPAAACLHICSRCSRESSPYKWYSLLPVLPYCTALIVQR